MLLTATPGVNRSSEYGTRMVLYPRSTIWSTMLR